MQPEVFQCTRKQMTLTVSGCTRLHEAANKPRAPDPWLGMVACRGCPTGAMHRTGKMPNPMETISAAMRMLCPRCGRISDRMIWGRLCASCDARHAEALRGRNSKGSVPKLTHLLHPEHVALGSGDQVKLVHRQSVTSLGEVMIGMVKSALTPVTFGLPRVFWPSLVRSSPHRPWSAQYELSI